MKITTKHVKNSFVTFVTHERSAVFFFLPSCCVNSLIKAGEGRETARRLGREQLDFSCGFVARAPGSTKPPCYAGYLHWWYQQEGILHANACIRWTTIAWAHQIWWWEIENLYKGTVLLKAISLVLWIPYFPTKNILHEKKRTLSTRGFICKFSKVGFFGPLKTFKTQRQKVMFLCKSDFHWQSNAFLWFDFQTRVLLIR